MKIPEIKVCNCKVVFETSIPFKEIDYVALGLSNCNKRNPLADDQKILIECIEARMYECYCKLNHNMSRVFGNDGEIVLYKTEDGTIESFNMPSWNAMCDVRKALQQQCYDHYSGEMTDQLLKSVVLGPVPRTCFKNYNAVVRYLLESLMMIKL